MIDEIDEKTLGNHLDSGERILLSMGDFVSLLIDGGTDHIVFKVIEDNGLDDTTFHLKLEVDVVPEKHILDFCDNEDVQKVYGRIFEAIERGIIKRRDIDA